MKSVLLYALVATLVGAQEVSDVKITNKGCHGYRLRRLRHNIMAMPFCSSVMG